MTKISREFQIFVKPTGSTCNLSCHYCYYLNKDTLYPEARSFQMTTDILEEYIRQHINASTDVTINFSWHGGEPTILGLDYYKKIVELQYKYKPNNRYISNGIQTNGTLLDEDWGRFFSSENFLVGISLDGPQEIHDLFRLNKVRKSTFAQTIHGYKLLQQYQVSCEILCVINSQNVHYPLQIYRFFKQLGTKYITFLPLVEYSPHSKKQISSRSVSAEDWGNFLCTIFDEWQNLDIGKVKIQIFEEALRSAFNQEHTLCIFKKTCGNVAVIEHSGDFYSCDFFVNTDHLLGNIKETNLVDLLESPAQKKFGQNKLTTLPRYCLECVVLDMCNGECPKNRFICTPAGEPGLNYLCSGYKKFFQHCQPFIAELATLWQQQQIGQIRKNTRTYTKIGRNDPCPCGSNKKYKNCCLKNQLG